MSRLASAPDGEVTYDARLHLGGRDAETGAQSYRTIDVRGLEHPHIETVESTPIHDPTNNETYSLRAVPGLIGVDFPGVSVQRSVTPEWLSHEKRELYERALQLGEDHEASIILGRWLEAHMRTSHFVDEDPAGNQILVSASKLCTKQIMSRKLGESLAVFTFGPGRKNLTPAISAVIAVAAEKKLLLAAPPPMKNRVNLGSIALFQLAVASGDLPLNPHYLLAHYTEDGEYVHPEQKQLGFDLQPDEVLVLREAGLLDEESTQLTKAAMSVVLRRRVNQYVTEGLQLMMPYPTPDDRTPAEIEIQRAQSSAKLLRLAPDAHRTPPADTPEHREYLAGLEARWKDREAERKKTLPVT